MIKCFCSKCHILILKSIFLGNISEFTTYKIIIFRANLRVIRLKIEAEQKLKLGKEMIL